MGAAAYWDREAATYDRRTAWLERRLLAPARQWVAERARGRTLEVAVGTGANLPYYGDRVGRLTIADVSPRMLEAASARARTLGRRVEAELVDGARLPMPDASFDTVVCTFAMCCVEDERAVLRELARVLRPDGTLLLADHVESSAALGRGVQRVLDAITPDEAGEHHRRRPLLLLPAAGLEPVEHEASRWRLVERVAARRAG